MVNNGATVDIYEHVIDKKFFKNFVEYFHRPLEFWDKMGSDLEQEAVILRLTTVADDCFTKIQNGFHVRARIECRPAERYEC